MAVNDGLGALFATIMMFVLIYSLIMLIIYVLGAVWEMQFLQRVGYDKPWLAWIPFGNYYAMADVAYGTETVDEELYLFKKRVPIWVFKYFTLLVLAGNIVLGMIPIVGSILWIIDILVYIACFVPIMKTIACRFGVEVSDGRCILDSIINLVGFYDVWAWSDKAEFSTGIKKNKYVDTIIEDTTVMDLDDNSPSMQ